MFDAYVFPNTSDYLTWDYIYTINSLVSSQIDSLRDVLKVTLAEVHDPENLSHCLLMCRVFDPYLSTYERKNNLERCARIMFLKLNKIGRLTTSQPATITSETRLDDFLKLFTTTLKLMIVKMPQSQTLSPKQKLLITHSQNKAKNYAQEIQNSKGSSPSFLSHILVIVSFGHRWSAWAMRKGRSFIIVYLGSVTLMTYPIVLCMAIKPKIGIKCFSIMMFISIACFLTVFAHVLLTHVKHDLRKVRNVKTSAEVNIEQIVKVVEHVMKNIGGFFPQQIRKKNDTRSS